VYWESSRKKKRKKRDIEAEHLEVLQLFSIGGRNWNGDKVEKPNREKKTRINGGSKVKRGKPPKTRTFLFCRRGGEKGLKAGQKTQTSKGNPRRGEKRCGNRGKGFSYEIDSGKKGYRRRFVWC